MHSDTCVICGTDVPEGRQVCPNCQRTAYSPEEFFSAERPKQCGGLHGKYIVLKSDTREPVGPCFVLRPDRDEAARRAILAYAYFISKTNKELSRDLVRWIGAIEKEANARLEDAGFEL